MSPCRPDQLCADRCRTAAQGTGRFGAGHAGCGYLGGLRCGHPHRPCRRYAQVAAGSTVILYISRPQVSTTTKVPSLTGMSVDDARTLLVQNHLGLGSQSEEYSDQPAGTVLSQNPAAGTTAKLNSRVNVVVSAGAAPVQEPEQPGGDGTTSGTTGEGSTGGESTGGSSEPSPAAAPQAAVFWTGISLLG